MTAFQLPLRDVHEPAAPPWWPPAPGWWMVLGGVLLVIGLLAWLRWRRARPRRRAGALFDRTVAAARTAPEQVAAMSALLRRAARRQLPDAATRQGESWLQLLDEGLEQPAFASGAGRLLLDGAFRPQLDDAEVEALRAIARARFIDWMQVRQ